jgi:hypothetical protein
MKAIEFKDQYKHPLWQKKRLEALDAAEYTCERCYDSESQLHVHHRQYFKDRMIWEYQTSELEVLCDLCHETAHAEIDEIKQLLSVIPTQCIPGIAALIKGYAATAIGPIRSAGIQDEISQSNPSEYIAGQIAATSEIICSVYEMQSLRDQLFSSYLSSGTVKVDIKKDRRNIHREVIRDGICGEGFKYD